jgi:hypothetical protein
MYRFGNKIMLAKRAFRYAKLVFLHVIRIMIRGYNREGGYFMHLSRQSIRAVATHEALIESDNRVKQGNAAMTSEEVKQFETEREYIICTMQPHEMLLHIHEGLTKLVYDTTNLSRVFGLNPEFNHKLTELLEHDQAALLTSQKSQG